MVQAMLKHQYHTKYKLPHHNGARRSPFRQNGDRREASTTDAICDWMFVHAEPLRQPCSEGVLAEPRDFSSTPNVRFD
jgi:hypothetical protein